MKNIKSQDHLVEEIKRIPFGIELVAEAFRWHKKIIKPWKKTSHIGNVGRQWEDEKFYVQGYNECLKEIEKNHKKFMKFYEAKFMPDDKDFDFLK